MQKMQKRSSLPNDAGVTGNTKSDPKAKRWCFTWNGYPSTAGIALKNFFRDRRARCWIFGREKGELGTKHLQGYVEFKSDRRFSTLRKLAKGHLHWEKARGTREENADYCAKDGDWDSMGAIEPAEKLDDPLDGVEQHQWQKDLTEIVMKRCIPHSREIYWLIGYEGAEGKTSWAKSMVIRFPNDVLYVSGKAIDMKYAIAARLKDGKRAPKTIVLGIPRSRNPEAVSYAGLEELKDGLFFSSKYESKMIVFNTPHVIVLANQGPAFGKFSQDRLKEWDLNLLMQTEEMIFNERRKQMIDANLRAFGENVNGQMLRGIDDDIPMLLTRSNAMLEPELMDAIRNAESLSLKRQQIIENQEKKEEKIENFDDGGKVPTWLEIMRMDEDFDSD